MMEQIFLELPVLILLYQHKEIDMRMVSLALILLMAISLQSFAGELGKTKCDMENVARNCSTPDQFSRWFQEHNRFMDGEEAKDGDFDCDDAQSQSYKWARKRDYEPLKITICSSIGGHAITIIKDMNTAKIFDQKKFIEIDNSYQAAADYWTKRMGCSWNYLKYKNRYGRWSTIYRKDTAKKLYPHIIGGF